MKKEETVKRDYASDPSLNFSLLKVFNYSPRVFKAVYDYRESQDTQATILGSAIHCLVLEPQEFHSRYQIEKAKVEGLMGKFIEGMVLYDEDVNKAYMHSGYKISLERVLENFNEAKCQDYYKFLKEKGDRYVLSDDDWIKAHSVARSIIEDKYSKQFFMDEEIDPYVESFNEIEVFWEWMGYSLKSKLDRVIVDRRDKKIYLVDIKTHYDSFEKNYKLYRYDQQMAFYRKALQCAFPEYEGYEIEIRIVAVQTRDPYPVTVFRPSDEDVNRGIVEIEDMLNALRWHFDNDIWVEKSYYEKGFKEIRYDEI